MQMNGRYTMIQKTKKKRTIIFSEEAKKNEFHQFALENCTTSNYIIRLRIIRPIKARKMFYRDGSAIQIVQTPINTRAPNAQDYRWKWAVFMLCSIDVRTKAHTPRLWPIYKWKCGLDARITFTFMLWAHADACNACSSSEFSDEARDRACVELDFRCAPNKNPKRTEIWCVFWRFYCCVWIRWGVSHSLRLAILISKKRMRCFVLLRSVFCAFLRLLFRYTSTMTVVCICLIDWPLSGLLDSEKRPLLVCWPRGQADIDG